MRRVPDLAERLAARTLELVDIASESRDEELLAAHVAAVLQDGGVPARDLGDTCVLAGDPGSPLLLAGHLDTVPAQGNRPGRIEDGRVHGLGASDMKGALAVMIELALARAPFRYLFFGREELPVQDSALTPLLEREPLAAELVVMMEPTACELHAGCLGNVNATWTFRGRSGHSARPWTADNAIERAAAGVLALAAQPPVPHTFDGLEFVEVASVTTIAGGIAANVIPDRVECHVNFRYAPGRSAADGGGAPGRAVRGPRRAARSTPTRRRGPWRRDRASTRSSPPASSCARPSRPGRRSPSSASPACRPSTSVPGDPAQAHRRDESVEIAALVRAYEVLERFGVRVAPALSGLETYPFVRLAEAKRRLLAAGADLIDFGIGEPREQTPAFIREALVAALDPLSTYPQSDGLPELRAAVAGWAQRRFGAALDPDTQVLPTLGSKEAIFHLAQVLGGGRVAIPAPAYPVYERGALFAGKQALELPLREDGGFLPDLDAVAASTWRDVAILWLNYPNNPTAATAPRALYERASELAREHGFVLASDEAYSEIYFGDEPPASALELPDLSGVLVFNTLSKRSSMPGYRSGFVAGDRGADRAAQALPAERRHRAAGVHPARRGRGLERRGARRAGARVLRRQARRAARRARGARPAQRRRRRDVLPLARRRAGRRRARRAPARRRDRARARIVLRARGRRLPAAGARADAGRVRARGRAPRRAAVTGHGATPRDTRGRAVRAGSPPPGSR